MDNDNDVDVVGAAWIDDDIAWFENDGDQDFTENTVIGNFDGVSFIYAEDIDGDDDIDIVGAGWDAGELAWYENDLNPHQPGSFTLISPEDDALIDSNSCMFDWSESIDPDGDEISYTVFLADNEDFTDPAEIDAGTATTILIDNLEDDTDYWWKVRAEDQEFVIWSDTTWSFNTEIPDPPEAFSLAAPDSGSISMFTQVELTWNETTDPDPDDEIVYDVYVSTNPDDLGDAIGTGLRDTEYTFDAPDQVVYYWTIHARDTNTDGTWASETWSFEVTIQEPPSNFNLLLPEDNSIIPLADPYLIELVWESSVDPDPGEDVAYDLAITVTFEDNSEEELNFTGSTDTVFSIDIPSELGIESWSGELNVEWLVEAVSERHRIESDSTFNFTLESNVGVSEGKKVALPRKFGIATYPNPFNPNLSVVISLPIPSDLKITVLDILGREIALLADGHYTAGHRKYTFNAENLSSGIYLVHASVPGKMNEVRKVVLIR
ncbi:MAG: T9SS type A sorting domain-containing protein [Candidatus Electryonea clarkiae]|nr:T9SS type A sorting domain-containing protein [Candidatus Electryonea clarkiae]MDP8286885.1 T9SS type A sorting domain-containing protein [Candidatus Electryonea clarkiae]